MIFYEVSIYDDYGDHAICKKEEFPSLFKAYLFIDSWLSENTNGFKIDDFYYDNSYPALVCCKYRISIIECSVLDENKYNLLLA